MIDFFQAFFLIFIAEMGDKTQIIAMAFATQYSVRQILAGVWLGSFLNHGIAIILGAVVLSQIPLDALQLFSGLLFIAFGIFSLSLSEDEEDSGNIRSYGAIMTIAIAFFVGELGDKTQLTALALSTQATVPLLTLFGSATGMAAVSLVGIFVGIKLGDKIPEFQLKLIAFFVFISFGLFTVLRSSYVADLGVLSYFIIFFILTVLIILKGDHFRNEVRKKEYSALKIRAQKLKELKNSLNKDLDVLCMHCSVSDHAPCMIQYMQSALNSSLKKIPGIKTDLDCLQHENIDIKKVLAMKNTLDSYLDQHPELKNDPRIIEIKNSLEHIINEDQQHN